MTSTFPEVSCTISTPSTPTLAPSSYPSPESHMLQIVPAMKQQQGSTLPLPMKRLLLRASSTLHRGGQAGAPGQGGRRRTGTRWKCWSHPPRVPEHPPHSLQESKKTTGERVTKGTAPRCTAPVQPSVNTGLRKPCFPSWYKQQVKYSLCLPYLNLRDCFSHAQSPGGRINALGPGTTNERPLGVPAAPARRGLAQAPCPKRLLAACS